MMTINAGTKLGRYEIRSKIGEGGMGEVYRARDTRLDREAASLNATPMRYNPAGQKAMAARQRKEYGEYIVSDPKICGGDLTFKGTRVLVKDVLYYVSQGKD